MKKTEIKHWITYNVSKWEINSYSQIPLEFSLINHYVRTIMVLS